MKADTRVDVKKTDVPEIVCESDLYYNVDDIPPVGTTLFYGFQLAVSNVCYFILLSLTIQDFICADRNFATTMFSTMSFMAGVSTIIQTYFGVRLPVFQGPSVIWFLAYGNVKNDPKWGCNLNNTAMASTSVNGTDTTAEDNAPGWKAEWAKVAGALMVTQCVQMLLGATGLIALLGRIIRPITIAVFFILISLYLHEIIANFCRENWWISSASILVVLILAQYIHWIKIPMPTWTPKKGCTVTKMPVFELFSMLLAVLILWALTAILTAAGVFTDNKDDIGYQVRTDIHSKAIDDAPVFIWPQPGQFVREIDFDVGYFAILLVPVFATIIESMGDYSQFAMSCCMPRPPAHAVNRGIFIEGLCGFFCALLGMGMATTSYSHIAGFFRVTKVGSRLVYLVAGIMLIILAVFGKVGAVFVSIPKPVLAGPIFIGTALLVGATFMNLSYVDLAKSRSQTILGCSIMIGVLVPFYIVRSPIKTGSDIADRLLTSVISPHYLLGAFIAAILDNTLPGRADAVIQSVVPAQQGADVTTPLEANGMIELGAIDAGKQDKPQRTYDGLMKGYDPPFISKYTRRWKCSRFVPMLPNPYSEDKQGTGPTSTNL